MTDQTENYSEYMDVRLWKGSVRDVGWKK